ncbi:DsbA family protein [Terrarubrum flagellatum]|uniref:DsbA family protein n=1 Tax=Terrirubrum flagellatum TaxID=2895980 RepID=UPI003144F79F
MIDRRALITALATAGAAPAFAQEGEATRFDISPDVTREALALPATFRMGSRNGSITLVEFFDYNCPWCRRGAHDVDALVKGDSRLRLILVNYAILGVASVLAHKVALAVAMDSPEAYPTLHRELLGMRGVADGDAAIAIVRKIGLDVESIAQTANSDVVTAALTASADFGARNNLSATPSWLIGRSAYVGYLPSAQMKGAIAAARA